MANELVTVGDFVFVPEAEAARLHLQEEGIQAFLSNAELVNMDWMLGNATGYVKILVRADQAIAARDILETLQAQKQARRRDRFTAGETSACLACGEKLPAEQSTCAACGWSYAADADENGADDPSETGEPGGPAGDRGFVSGHTAAWRDKEALGHRAATPEKNEAGPTEKEVHLRIQSDGNQHDRELGDRELGDRELGDPAETDEDAQELAEASAANLRLLIGLVIGGAILLWLLPQLRVAVRSWL